VIGGIAAGAVWGAVLSTAPVRSQAAVPTVLDPDLAVTTVVSGLAQPIGMAFIDQVRRVAPSSSRPEGRG